MPNEDRDPSIAAHPAPLPDGRNRVAPPPQEEAPPAGPRRRWRRWLIVGAIAAVVLGAALFWGVPYLREYFTTVSTDDAYVNAHATTVAPRVEDNVTEVLVDNGKFVTPGTALVKLDPEPYQVVVDQKRAALEVAQAQLAQTLAKVRSQEAQARASWFTLQGAKNQVRSQLATLRANVANLRLARANLEYNRSQYNRISGLVPSGAATREELEQTRTAVSVSESQVAAAQEAIQQTRAALGLERNEKDPLQVPPGLEQNFPAVQVALSNAVVALAQIGFSVALHNLTPDALYEQLVNMTPSRDLNRTLDELVDKAPETRLARSQVEVAQKDLDQAELNLSYTTIRADIAGVVNQRNVNPGDHVQKGQNLMTVRSLDEVWIDANFKETQLDPIVIGQPVDVTVDAYPHRVFRGRVAGFTPATGSVSALLPPENATGNFVKIVQRLPVRIELTEPNPRDTPLLAGLSVVPTVRIREQPTGPNAGERIRDLQAPEEAAQPPGPQRPRTGQPGAGPGPGRSPGSGASTPGQPRVRQGAGPILP
jgi:membrane fusion protein (multidrug efflux system)